MTKKTIAAEVENTDLVASLLTGVIQFCKKNKRGVIAALVILALSAATGSFYAAHQKKVAEESWAAYYVAQTALLTQGEEEGFKQIDALAQAFPNTNAAQYALLLKGDTLYAHENYAQACTKNFPTPKTKPSTPWPRYPAPPLCKPRRITKLRPK